jgi:competence protein ComGF
MMMLETLLALMLVVNILLLIALMTFAYKLNKDWANFMLKVNAEWVAFAGLLMGAFDDVEEEEIWD